MLRSQALLTCPGHISTICKAYRELGPGATLHRAPDESFSGRELVSPAVMILQFMAHVLYCLAHLEGKLVLMFVHIKDIFNQRRIQELLVVCTRTSFS